MEQQPIIINFDATTVDPQGNGGGGLPVGRHKVAITEAVQGAVKDKPQSGKLTLKLSCVEGTALNQFQNDTLNLWNENPEAARIAWQQLSAYMHVIGVYRAGDIRELFNKPFYVDVALQKGDNPKGYTEITALYDLAGNPPGKQGQAAPVQPAQSAPIAAPAQPAAWTPPAGAQPPPAQPQAAAPPQNGWNAPQGQPGPAPAPAAWAPQAQGGQPAAPAAPWNQG